MRVAATVPNRDEGLAIGGHSRTLGQPRQLTPERRPLALRRLFLVFQDRGGVVASCLVPMLGRDTFENVNGPCVERAPFEQRERLINDICPFRSPKVCPCEGGGC